MRTCILAAAVMTLATAPLSGAQTTDLKNPNPQVLIRPEGQRQQLEVVPLPNPPDPGQPRYRVLVRPTAGPGYLGVSVSPVSEALAHQLSAQRRAGDRCRSGDAR